MKSLDMKVNNNLSRSNGFILLQFVLIYSLLFEQNIHPDVSQKAHCRIVDGFFKVRGNNSNVRLVHVLDIPPHFAVHFKLNRLQILVSLHFFLLFTITELVPNHQQNVDDHADEQHYYEK